jgi:type II secretion system (T2SS) protein E
VSSSDEFPHIPRTRDGSPNWAADTDPVGPVTPELALVDPELSRGQINSEVTMSSMEFGDGTTFGATEPVQAPFEAQPAVPLQPIQPLAPPAVAPAPEPTPPAPAEPATGMAVADMRDVPLGTLVFRAGLLPEERLEEALQEGMKTGKRLGEILLERGWVSETDLGRLLAGQKGLPFVELDPAAIDPTAPPLLPAEKARLHGALPIGFEAGVPVVAVADPSNDLVVENVRRALACEPVLVVAGRDALHRAISHVYGLETPVQAPVEVVAEPVAAPVVESQPVQTFEPVAPVVQPVAPVAPVAPTAPEPVVPVVPPPAVEPVATQPVQNGEGVWLGQQPDLVQQPLAPTHPTVEMSTPEPVAQTQPAPFAPPVEAPAMPVMPEPVAEPVTEPAPQPEAELTWSVVLRLANGERLELGSFPGEAAATEQARAVVAQVSSEEGWPFVGGRFIRPDAIVSVDLVELEVSRWLGSSARAAALTPQQPQPTGY